MIINDNVIRREIRDVYGPYEFGRPVDTDEFLHNYRDELAVEIVRDGTLESWLPRVRSDLRKAGLL